MYASGDAANFLRWGTHPGKSRFEPEPVDCVLLYINTGIMTVESASSFSPPAAGRDEARVTRRGGGERRTAGAWSAERERFERFDGLRNYRVEFRDDGIRTWDTDAAGPMHDHGVELGGLRLQRQPQAAAGALHAHLGDAPAQPVLERRFAAGRPPARAAPEPLPGDHGATEGPTAAGHGEAHEPETRTGRGDASDGVGPHCKRLTVARRPRTNSRYRLLVRCAELLQVFNLHVACPRPVCRLGVSGSGGGTGP